ncbi:MAG: hypothetical protein KBT14_04135, partial [Proteobacteria bacterium]|nr:hypothetical protein [Candidatus Enterousia onthequi]
MVKAPANAGDFLFYGMVIYIIKNRHSAGVRNPVLHFAKLVSFGIITQTKTRSVFVILSGAKLRCRAFAVLRSRKDPVLLKCRHSR